MLSRSIMLSATAVAASIFLASVALVASPDDARSEEKKKPAPVQHSAPPPPPAPHFVAPHPNPPPRIVNQGNPQLRFTPNTRVNTQTTTRQRNFNANVNVNVQQNRVNNGVPLKGKNLAVPNNLTGPGPNGLKFGPGKPTFGPQNAGLKPGPNGLRPGPGGLKPTFPVVSVNNKFFPIHKGPKFMFLGGQKRFFVPLAALGVVAIGGSYWYPDGYVSIGQPYCAGYTPDGCSLHWRMVDFEDGGGEPQCVQYCPQVGPPPAEIAALPPPPPPPPSNASCQVTIFADPNFGGLSAPSSDSQPNLGEAGWQNQISSIQVQAGTWDFFTEPNYGGISMRLPGGAYPTLTPDWDKKIGSFMCVQPGPGA